MGRRVTASTRSKVSNSAVAGFGLSAGRDVWNMTKRNGGLLLFLAVVLAAAVLPFYGARGMVRGHDRSRWGTILNTVLGNLAIAIGGALIGGATVAFACLIFGPATFTLTTTATVALSLIGSLAGLVTGLAERRSRLASIAVRKTNERFLDGAGVRETGEEDVTHYDAEGNALRLVEFGSERLVFMAVGRRGKRAYIQIAPSGEMISYSGIVS